MLRNIALVAAGLSVVKGQLNAGLLMQYEEELILKGGANQCELQDQVALKDLPTGTDAYTLEAMIRPTIATKNSQGIMGWGEWGRRSSANALKLVADRQLVNYWWANDIVADVAYSLNDGEYHHVAATFDGTVRNIFIDYRLINSVRSTTPTIKPGREFCVGSTNNRYEPFTGGMKSIRIWTVARTISELKAGLAKPTTTTATATTTTATTNTALQSMQSQLEKLQDLLASGGTTHEVVQNELEAVKGALLLLQEEVDMQRKDFAALEAKVDANFKLLSAANAEQDMQSAQFAADLQSAIAWQVMTPAPPPPPRGVCSGSGCQLEVSGMDDVLSLRAQGGTVTFESEQCEETDLCGLARSVQDLLGKFREE